MSPEKRQTPEEARYLIRNLERRKGLLARISKREVGDIPDIVIKDTLLKFLDKKYKGMEQEEIKDLNKRLFALINRAADLVTKKQDTAPVTSMYACQYADARPIDEQSYGEFLEEVKTIIELCKQHHISLKSITGMQHGLGVPDVKKLDGLLAWCTNSNVDLKSITGMQNGLGVPDVKKLDGLLAWCTNSNVDLKSITGMQMGLSVPDVKKLDDLLAGCEDNKVDLQSITGMQTGLGVPDVKKLDGLLAWCTNNEVDLKSITGMQVGIPSKDELNKLFRGRRGDESAVEQDP